MIKTPERRADLPKGRGRRRGHRASRLIPGLLVLCLAVGAFHIYSMGQEPEAPPVVQSRKPDQPLILTLTPPPTPEPTPIPVPELPDWIQEDLLPLNEWSRPGDAMEDMTGVVVHYVGNPNTTARQNRNYFASLAETHETHASSNFVIGLEGEILLCVPIGEVAYCSKERNIDTLSIEVCHPDKSGKFNQASYDSLVKLVNWLREFYDLDVDDVIRHYDVTGKECPRYYVDHEEAWVAFKADLEKGGGDG